MNDDDAERLRAVLAQYGGGSVLRVETRDDGRTAVMVRTVRRSLIRVIVLEVRDE